MQTHTQIFMKVDDNVYLIDPIGRARIHPDGLNALSRISDYDDYIPVSIPPSDTSYTPSKSRVQQLLDSLGRGDVTFSRGFTAYIVFPTERQRDILIEYLPQGCRVLILASLYEPVHPGPFAVHRWTGRLHRVSRLFQDTCIAFSQVCPQQLSPVSNLAPSMNASVAVPSKSYSGWASNEPLAGYRFTVKDVIDVEGFKTGCGSRAWAEIAQPAIEDAAVVKRLKQLGAVLIGKTKTSQFAEGATPSEWVDYVCPFNPRGDGYQSPSGSSTGSAVAVAAYPWLHFAIGTDTGGSIRAPAAANGVYAARISTTAVDMSGTFSVTPLYDSVGIIARDHYFLGRIVQLIVPESTIESPFRLPRRYRIVYPIHGLHSNQRRWFRNPSQGELDNSEQLMEQTLQQIEVVLGVTRISIDLEQLWSKTRPTGTAENLDEEVGGLYSTVTTYESVHRNIDPFIQQYRDLHEGKMPYIDPVPRLRQQYGRQQSDECYKACVQAGARFSEWVHTHLLSNEGDPTCIPVLFMPLNWGSPQYRDEMRQSPVAWDRFSVHSFGYLCGCPDFTVPIGEAPYTSRITEQDEYLPVSLSMVTRNRNDLELCEVLRRLGEANVLRDVKTGSRLFPE